MEQSQLLAHCGSSKITREELKVIPTPPASPTHQPVRHSEIVGALVETLSFRQISVVREEYAVSGDGIRFSVGARNSNDKSMRLALTVGYRVLVCDNMAFHGDFTLVLAKCLRRLSLVDILAAGVDRMQRNFELDEEASRGVEGNPPSGRQREGNRLPGLCERRFGSPQRLARRVHDRYFKPQGEELGREEI